MQELTPSVLNDMVKRVYVHAPQVIDGKRTQEIDIVYYLVGILPSSLFNNEKNGIENLCRFNENNITVLLRTPLIATFITKSVQFPKTQHL